MLPRMWMGLPLAACTSIAAGFRTAPLAHFSGNMEWSHPVSTRQWCSLPSMTTSMYVSGALPHTAPFAPAAGGALGRVGGVGDGAAPLCSLGQSLLERA